MEGPCRLQGAAAHADGCRLYLCERRVIRLHTLLARPRAHIPLLRYVTRVQHLPLSASVTIHRLTDISGTGVVAVRPTDTSDSAVAYFIRPNFALGLPWSLRELSAKDSSPV